VKGTDGRLVASTFNYQTGLSEGYRVSNFDPGSSVSFSLRRTLVPGAVVQLGDTIGSIYSSEMQERLISLNGQLEAAKSLLAVNASGQKAAIVTEAQQRLQFAIRRKNEHLAIETRNEQLFSSGLIPKAEHERVLNEANALQDEIQIAEANLEAARTGAKPEQLALVHANIAALKNEIAAIERREATYTLTSPISGTVYSSFASDTLLTIADTRSYVALIPVRWGDYSRVASTHEPRLTVGTFPKKLEGRIVGVNREMKVLFGQKVVVATGLLDASSGSLMPGMLAHCRIECMPLTVRQHLKRIFMSLTSSGEVLWNT
jgi:hypothetical protein